MEKDARNKLIICVMYILLIPVVAFGKVSDEKLAELTKKLESATPLFR